MVLRHKPTREDDGPHRSLAVGADTQQLKQPPEGWRRERAETETGGAERLVSQV